MFNRLYAWYFRRLFPARQLIEWSRDEDFSPDVWQLEMRDMVPIFEYGEAMRTGKLYSMLGEHSFCVGVAFTCSSRFRMWQRNLEEVPFPIALEAKGKLKLFPYKAVMPEGRIKGELHWVRAGALYALDKQRLNGIQFIRTPIAVDVPHRKELKITNQSDGTYKKVLTGEQHYKKIEAFTYIGVSSYWNDLLDGGFHYPRSRYVTPEGVKSKPYYEFII